MQKNRTNLSFYGFIQKNAPMRIKIIYFVFAIFVALQMNAQSLVDDRIDTIVSSTHVVSFGGVGLPHDSVRQQIEMFYYDQFRHSQDPAAPYFLFMSKDGVLSMGIGGVVRMRAWYDWGGAMPVSSFTPILIPMTPNPMTERQIGTTPAGVSLYLECWDTQMLLAIINCILKRISTAIKTGTFT